MTTSQRTPRRAFWRLIAVLAALMLIAAGCGGGDDDGAGGGGGQEEEGGKPVTGGSLTVGLEAETNTWLPGKYAGSNSGTTIQLALFDPLMRRSEKGDLEPFLAESVTPSDDLKTWTVKLRSGVKFHDGTPLNAEAMKYNFDNLLNVDGSNTKGTLTSFKVTALEVVDELTYKYVLGDSNAAFSDLLDGTIGMPFSPKAHQDLGEEAGNNPVGTGAFTFASWQRDSSLVVKKNASYWMKDKDGTKLPYLDQITFRPIPDEDTRLQSLLSGDIDVFHTLRQSIVRQARESKQGGTIGLYEHIGNNGGGAIYNTKTPPVDDVRVRLGLAWSLDQEALVEILGGTGITPPQTQWFSPNSPYFSAKVDKAWPQNDPTKGKKLLEEYVNDPNRSDKKAVGSPIAVDFNCPPDPSLIELAQAYQQMWGAVGVQVKLNQVEQAAHIQNAIQDKYMINCWRMGGGDDPYTTLSVAFGDPATQNLNFTNYRDEEIAAQIELLRTETDFDKRKVAVEKIMLRFTEVVPNLWTGGTATAIGYKPTVKNIAGFKLPDGAKGEGAPSAVATFAQVWVEE